MHLKLSSKILMMISVSSIIMVSFMVFFGFKFSRESVEQQTSKLMQDRYADVFRQIDSLLANYITQINIISTDRSLQRGLISTSTATLDMNDEINLHLSTLLIYSGPWDDLILLNNSGKTIAASSVHTGNKITDIYMEEVSMLENVKSEYSACTDVFVVDNTNIMSCVSSVRMIVDGKEKVAGYVLGRIALRSIDDVLSNSSENIVLYNSEGSVITKNINSEIESIINSSEIATFSGNSRYYIQNLNNIPYMVTITRERGIPGYKGNGWVLTNVSDVSSYINKGESGINKLIYITAFIFLLIAVSITLFLRRIVSIPVTKLQVAATAVSAGDFNQVMEIKSYDEIGDLSKAFNEMSNQLSSAYSSLEDKIKSKTKELEVKIKELEDSKLTTEKALNEIESAEERLLEKNKQVEGAFDEIQHFARVADKERLTYSLLISSIGEAVMVIDPDGAITVSNNVCAQMLSTTTDLLQNKSMFDFVELHSDTNTLVDIKGLGKIVSEDKLYNFKYWNLTRKTDNERFTISGVIAPVIDNRSGGIVRGMIFTFRDVIVEKMLEDARIGFISTASHQLRTPLTSMKWFTEMLHDGDAGVMNENQKHFVERISEGIDRMVGLVNMLLQIARIEAGRTAIEPTPVNLREIIEGVAKTIEVELNTHNQKVSVTSDPVDYPTIPLDKDYIWQIIQNLLTNAQRYSFDGTTIEVHIGIDGNFAVVSVKDYGIGIPEVSKSRLFEKFYRAENALTKVPSGTGLGLVLIKMLVDEMNGELSFESKEGVGTTFFVRIPLAGMKARSGEVKLSV